MTKEENKRITNLGFTFPIPFLIFGWGIAIAGLIFFVSLIVNEPIYSPLVLPIILGGLYMGATTDESEYSSALKACRNCKNFFGYRRGEWKSLNDYPTICILKQNWVSNTYSRSNRQMSVENMKYDICLMDKRHWDKLILQQCNGLKEAEQKAQEISSLIDAPIVDYKPYISERSRANRRR